MADKTDEQLLSEERVEARKVLEAMEVLESSPAWEVVKKCAKNQILVREQQVVYDRGCTERDRISGEAAGIKIFLNLPEDLIEDAKRILKTEDDDNG